MEIFLRTIIIKGKVEANKIVDNTISKLIDNERIVELAKSIRDAEKQVLDIFTMYKEKEEFKEKHLNIPNANAKKEYDFIFDTSEFQHIIIKEIRNIKDTGLEFDSETKRVYGIPKIANTIDLEIVFYSERDESKSEGIKIIPFIINPDPKDLWKNIPSDKNIRFHKEDAATYSNSFLDKKIVVASQRGRSHAQNGSCRDDDFKVAKLSDNWEIIAVADGAGSAKYSRQGSKFATEFITTCFDETSLISLTANIKNIFSDKEINEDLNEDEQKQKQEEFEKNRLSYKSAIINILYKQILALHNNLIEFSKMEEINLKDLHTTLIFVLCKKFDFGYIVLSFGVGDCPINMISSDNKTIELLNTLDIGESSGGTRFITMPEIFNDKATIPMQERFKIYKTDNFSKLFLMTDGIYDPKFTTENKLEDLDTWNKFLRDLKGENEDENAVDFENDTNIEKQLLKWTEFWSKGEHDDRTLAIIY